MILAAAGDPTLFVAFAAGFLSFISPCVLPLVPGYISAVSGVGLSDLQDNAGRTSQVLLPAIAFCLTFTLVFVALGMTATGLGSTLNDNQETLRYISGGLIVVFGVFFLLTPVVPKLNREWRVDALMQRAGSGGPIIAGAAFAIAWTPCIGPTLGIILTWAGEQSTLDKGAVLLVAYSLGLAVPFLVTALAFNRATQAFRWIRTHYTVITAVSGAVLVGMGILLLTDQLTVLNSEAQQALDAVGLGGLYDI